MEYVYLLLVIVIIQETSELNPDILKYDEWIKDAETTVKKIKANEKRKEEYQINKDTYIHDKRETNTFAAEPELVAISPIIGSEEVYLQIKKLQKPPLTHPNHITPNMKAAMCTTVLKSPLFDVLYRVDPVCSNNKAIYARMKENHPNIYRHLYKSVNPPSRDVFVSNPYRIRNVTVNGVVVSEDVFLCLAIDRVSKKIVEYFISLSYNVVNEEFYKYDEKRGRFIFRSNEINQEIEVIALAEEPAYIFDHAQKLAKITYFQVVENYLINDQNKMQQTICGLTTHQKIRLCALVLGAEKYRPDVKFLPHKDSIEPKCARRAVRFSYDRDDLIWDHDVDQDWMVGCRAVDIKNNRPVVYLVSAGIQIYEHFICLTPSRKDHLLSGVNSRIRVKEKLQMGFG